MQIDPSSLRVLIAEILGFLDESIASSLPVYTTPEGIRTACWRIPMCDLEPISPTQTPNQRATPTANKEGFYSTLAIFESYLKRGRSTDLDIMEWATQWTAALCQNMSSALPYISLAAMAPCPRPLLTSRGWVGRGPAGMREGDIIVILWGSRMPFVLRPCGDGGEEKYQLVGDAYVHGLMDGEFIQNGAVREEKVFCLV